MGSGRVGASIAFLCVSNALDDVLLLDRTKDKAIGESLDIANTIPSTSKFYIHGTDDYSKLSGSDIVVIATSTGVYIKDRMENMSSQVIMIKEIAGKIKQYCPSAIVLLISNPLDILTYFFQRESGLSRFKVIGVASSLDSSRFRYCISEKLSIPQSSISDAIVLGEHGDSMVPVFSGVYVSGKALLSMIDGDEKDSMTSSVRNYWKKLRSYKSRSHFGIAKNAYDVINAIINSKELAIPASVVLEGEYGENDVAMGVPIKITSKGIMEIKDTKLDESEQELFKISAQSIRNNIQSI